MNEHIENYCIEYIESEFNPQFAILLKGEWGCGKTYFINNLISRYKEKGQKLQSHEIIYISLYGIGNISEIDDVLFQKMHPILSSKIFKISTGVIRSAIKFGISFGSGGIFNIDGIDITSTEKIESKELEKKLLIIDDIERSNLNPVEIFGYFSEYLYQLNMKLIFIGNEDKILETDYKKENYLEIKEKTIGVEFTIKPEIEKAIDFFIKELSFDIDTKYLRDNCLEAISILNCKNLRTMRQCLYNLKLFYNALEQKIIKKYKDVLSKIFINLFIQKSLNIISGKHQIRDAIIGFNEHKLNYNDYIKLKEEKKWVFDYYNKYIPLNSIWPDIIFDGDYSKQKIKETYHQENKAGSVKKQKNLFVLMSDWRVMTKQEFKSCIDIVNNELENGIYLHPGEILHYTNIMIIFCEWKLIDGTKRDLVERVKKIVIKIKERIIPIDDWAMLGFSYAGWGFSNEISEVNEMRDYIKNISTENLFISLKSNIKEDIKHIKNDVHAFCRDIIHVNGTNRYFRKPYLSLLNIDDFFNELKSLSIDNQSLIIASFEERYGITYSNGSIYSEYKEDKENLLKLSKLYDDSLGDIEYNPPELLKKDISERLHKLLAYFNRQDTNSNITPI